MQPLRAKNTVGKGRTVSQDLFKLAVCVVEGEENTKNGNTKTNLEQKNIICIWQASYL